MSEEATPTIEDLQKQLLDMKKQREEDAAKLAALETEAKARDADLKAARELNAQLISKVPGEGASPEEDPDPYEGLTDMETLEKMSVELVDRIAAQMKAKSTGA